MDIMHAWPMQWLLVANRWTSHVLSFPHKSDLIDLLTDFKDEEGLVALCMIWTKNLDSGGTLQSTLSWTALSCSANCQSCSANCQIYESVYFGVSSAVIFPQLLSRLENVQRMSRYMEENKQRHNFYILENFCRPTPTVKVMVMGTSWQLFSDAE